jgi:AH receptor-interacting protein
VNKARITLYLVLFLTQDIFSENVKALFRRGKAHIGAWNPREAKSDFEAVIELDSSLEATATKELALLEKMKKEKDDQDRERMKKLF